ncbi:MAG: HAD family hydrolase [Clostridia bacterium]|nr:HAD family hydrolase [Clostridia bacterium]
MKKYSSILFDLDGTLIDSGVGVTNSVAYALEKFNLYVENRTLLACFIGPPLMYSFQNFYNFSEEKAIKAIEYYREYYTQKGIHEYEVYKGMAEVLMALRDAGYKLYVATSKPEEFARAILDEAGLSQYFDYIAGASMDERTRSTKEQVIEYALSTAQIEPSTAIMIGDRYHDIDGAHKFGMDSVGVLFGYGSYYELRAHKATYMVENPYDIVALLV